MNMIERMTLVTLSTAALALAVPVLAQDDLPMPVADQTLERAEIEQLLAPIALYPDAVLSNVLVAATYPLEIVQAARWSRANADLEGEAAVEAVDGQPWDPSVKALVAFPELLARMDEDLEWTQRLGDAMLMQEDEVMAAVQSLRERAYAANTLDDVEHITVRRVVHEERPAERVIVIEPADPQVIYVPVYRPTVVYGGWHWPHHAPYHWSPPSYYHYRAGFYWGRGIRYAPAYWFGAFDWHHHVIVVNVNRYKYKPRPGYRRGFRPPEPTGVWRHNPRHRRGVPYTTPRLQREYGRMPVAAPGELHPRPRPTVRSVRSQVAAGPARTATPRAVTPPRQRNVAPSRATAPRRTVAPRRIPVVEDTPRTQVNTRGTGRQSIPARPAPATRQAAPARSAPLVQVPQVRRNTAPPRASRIQPRMQARDMPSVNRGRSSGPAPVRSAPRRATPPPRSAPSVRAQARPSSPAPARPSPAAPARAAPAPAPRKQGPARTARDQER